MSIFNRRIFIDTGEPAPRLWPLVALALAGLLVLILSLVWTVAARGLEEGPEPPPLCLEPWDAHTLWGRARVCQMELQDLQELREAPECSSACADLEALAGRIEEGVSWAILPDGTAVKHPEGRYRFGTHRDWERAEALRTRCREDMEAGCKYRPGLPSTGQTPVVLESEVDR